MSDRRQRSSYSNSRQRARSTSSNNNNNSNSNNNSNGNNSGEYVKRSGCDMKDDYIHKSGPNKGQSSGSPCIWGWKIATGGAGLLKFVAVLAKEPQTKQGRWLKMVVKISAPNAAKFLTTGFWDTEKHRLHMPDMDLIANPGKDYFGRNYKPSK
jgi:hypothetical protein